MSKEESTLEYRVGLARSVYDSLNGILDVRIEETGAQLAKRFKFVRLFRAIGYVWSITKWECEAEILFEELDSYKLDVEREVFLNEFNEFLTYHRNWVIGYFRFTNAFPNESPEEMYDAITFGGKV